MLTKTTQRKPVTEHHAYEDDQAKCISQHPFLYSENTYFVDTRKIGGLNPKAYTPNLKATKNYGQDRVLSIHDQLSN